MKVLNECLVKQEINEVLNECLEIKNIDPLPTRAPKYHKRKGSSAVAPCRLSHPRHCLPYFPNAKVSMKRVQKLLSFGNSNMQASIHPYSLDLLSPTLAQMHRKQIARKAKTPHKAPAYRLSDTVS